MTGFGSKIQSLRWQSKANPKQGGGAQAGYFGRILGRKSRSRTTSELVAIQSWKAEWGERSLERALLMPRRDLVWLYGMVPPMSRHASLPSNLRQRPAAGVGFLQEGIVTGDNTASSGRNQLAPCNLD